MTSNDKVKPETQLRVERDRADKRRIDAVVKAEREMKKAAKIEELKAQKMSARPCTQITTKATDTVSNLLNKNTATPESAVVRPQLKTGFQIELSEDDSEYGSPENELGKESQTTSSPDLSIEAGSLVLNSNTERYSASRNATQHNVGQMEVVPTEEDDTINNYI